MMGDETGQAIDKNARGPKRVRGDEGEVEQHPLRDQIEADRYRKAKTGVETPTRGLRFMKSKPPGSA